MSNTSEIWEGCKKVLDPLLFELGCLAPALAIIFILAGLERRKTFKLDFCDGRPGLPVRVEYRDQVEVLIYRYSPSRRPVNFFSKHNRYTIAVTFGVTAITCTNLFIEAFLEDFLEIDVGIIPRSASPWLKIFEGLMLTLLYGVLFYPFFACLTTDHRLIGAVLGFIYGAIRLSFGLGIDFQCGSSSTKLFILLTLFPRLATYLCLLFVVIRFAVVIFREGRKRWFHSTNDNDRHGLASSENSLAREAGIRYVKLALNPWSNIIEGEVKWYTKTVHYIYKTRADFEFSTQLISSVMVAMMTVVELSIELGILFASYRSLCSSATCDDLDRIYYDHVMSL